MPDGGRHLGASTPRVRAAMGQLAQLLNRFPLEFVIEQGDLVTVVHHELRGEGESEQDFYGFHTFRFDGDEIAQRYSNAAVGTAPAGAGRAQSQRPLVEHLDGDPALNAARVAELYRCVFDAHDPGAVRDFVTEDYRQRSRHLPTGRRGLEDFVAEQFPDGPIGAPEHASVPPTVLMAQDDLVVIAAGVPQADGLGGTYTRYMYDGYRVRDGLLCEHWSGVDPLNRPHLG